MGEVFGLAVGPVGTAVGPVGRYVGLEDGPDGLVVGGAVGPVGAGVRVGRGVAGEADGFEVTEGTETFSNTDRILLLPLSDM